MTGISYMPVNFFKPMPGMSYGDLDAYLFLSYRLIVMYTLFPSML